MKVISDAPKQNKEQIFIVNKKNRGQHWHQHGRVRASVEREFFFFSSDRFLSFSTVFYTADAEADTQFKNVSVDFFCALHYQLHGHAEGDAEVKNLPSLYFAHFHLVST